MIVHNIDRQDQQHNTKAPFQWTCPMCLGDITLPEAAFRSIKVYMYQTIKPPVRIYSVTSQGVVQFVDSNQAPVGTWQIYTETEQNTPYVSDFILNENNIIVGHVVALSIIPSIFIGQARSHGGSIQTTPNDFILLPQCHVATMRGTCRAFNLGLGMTTKSCTLKASTGVMVQDNTYSVVPPHPSQSDSSAAIGICTLVVNERESFDVSYKHLIICSAVESNIRCIQEAGQLTLKGVKDV